MRPFGGRFRGLGPTSTMAKAAAEAEREDAQKAKEVDPEAPEQPASSPAEAEAISISLMRKMVLRFEEQKWVGAVQVSGTFSTPLSDSTFYIKALFGKVTASVERTEVKTPTKQAAEPKSMKWWTRKLDEKLSFLERKAKSLAFMFHSFEIRGRCGIVFNLGLQTPAITVGFQVTVELTVDCLLASLEEGQDNSLAKEIADHKVDKQKAKEKRAEKRPVRRLAKRIEERKAKRRGENGADQPREKDKDDAALEKMVLSVQAIKMKFESLAWYGLVTVKIGLGLMSFYVQVTTYRTQFGAQVETEAEAAEAVSDKQLSEEKQEESQLAEEVVELVDGEDSDAGSAVARAAETSSSDAKKKGAFGKGLNKAINRIKAASDAGFCGVQAGASFSFYVFGFGLEVDLYIDAAKVESNMGW